MVEEKTFRLLTWQIIPFGADYTVVKFGTTPGGDRSLSALIVGPDSGIRRELYSFKYANPNKTMEFPLIPHLLLVRPHGDELYLFDRKNGFPMRIYNGNGKLVGEISLETEKTAVTDTFKDEVWEWLELNKKWKRDRERRIKMVFPRYFPQLKNFLIKNGRIYCQTYRKKQEKSEFLILDLKGKVLGKTFLPHADRNAMDLWTQSPSYTIDKNKYYHLLENPDTDTWELHIIDISKNMTKVPF
jgi:hypothetical protein